MVHVHGIWWDCTTALRGDRPWGLRRDRLAPLWVLSRAPRGMSWQRILPSSSRFGRELEVEGRKMVEGSIGDMRWSWL